MAGTFTLQILHFYGESGLLATQTAPILGALVDKFDDQYANTLKLAEGDTFIPGPWLVGGADPSLNSVAGVLSTALGRPDIAIMNAIGVNASALGNHEFDLGSPVLQGAMQNAGTWVGAQFPFITANLDFSADSSLKPLADKSIGGNAANSFAGQEASAIKGKIAPYAIVTLNGEKIGIVGSTTFELLTKSSPNGTKPVDDNTFAVDANDLQEVATKIQAAVDALKLLGVNKIIEVDQLDTIVRNQQIASLVSGVDVWVAGGGHERLVDANDTLAGFNGHSATAEPGVSYPIQVTGADGKPAVIVTTDTEYSYLGRLVVDFDANGEIITGSLNSTINGAYASTEATLQAAYGTNQTAAQIVASSTIGSKVNAISSAINTVVAAKDGTIYGYTNVYLEGDRVFGRAQEVNLGDITADANAWVAKNALGLPGSTAVVSLKNGGGLRASIGAIDEDGVKVAPEANPAVNKLAGGISQLDVENALRFDNKLMVFETTAQGLLNILAYGTGLASGNGGWPQLGGVRVSYDPDVASKVQNISLIDNKGNVTARIVEGGVISPNAPSVIQVVVLNFTAGTNAGATAPGGDGYPIKANGTNFRYLFTDGTLSAVVDPALKFDDAAVIASYTPSGKTVLGEQKAFADYLTANHGTPATAYTQADTPQSGDVRIENLNARVDGVLTGNTVNGTAGNDALTGTAGNDTINGGDGNDVVAASLGNDSINGGNGTDTVSYASFNKGVLVNLAASEAKVFSALSGNQQLTQHSAEVNGENGFSFLPLWTTGDVIKNTTGALNFGSSGQYVLPGIPDGIGAYSKDANTVRVFMNHELGATDGYKYSLASGVQLSGSRISYIDIDKNSKAIVDAGLAFNTIVDRSGNVVTSTAQLSDLASTSGITRLCSGSLYEANKFGAGNGFADRIYFAGEETSNGTMFALDTATGILYAVPATGKLPYENISPVDTGDTTHVAFLIGSDNTGGPLYLYVGTKNAAGDFLDRNGLKNGQLYAWKPDAAGVNSPAEFASGSKSGTWVAINARDVSKAGTSGYDALGYKTTATLDAEADSKGAFSFARIEDLSTNPANGKQAAFNATGASITAAQTPDGVADATNTAGTVYKIDLNFTNGVPGAATTTVLYNSDADATKALRNPDNMDWSKDGYIYLDEDRSTAALFTSPSAANTHEASILRLDPNTGAVTRVGEIDRGAVPSGQTDTQPTDKGNWETSGILDVSSLFGKDGGSLFLVDVQAHSLNGGDITAYNLAEGGQLLLVGGPGVSLSANVKTDTLSGVENVIGTSFGDKVVGDGNANVIDVDGGDDEVVAGAGNDVVYAGAGNDKVDGGDGDDVLWGQDGSDTLSGGIGNDNIDGGTASDNIDGGAGNDFLYGGAGDDAVTGGAGNDGIFGGSGNDYMIGGDGDDSVNGEDGNDALFGGIGIDYLLGGAGDDSIDGDAGNDIVFGDAGDDYVRGGDGDDQVEGGTGTDKVFGDAGNDTVRGGDGDDQIDGGVGTDTLYGDAGNDWLFGGADNDQLDGGKGNDVLFGGAGADIVQGGEGVDTLYGEAGNDTLWGGLGADYFSFGDGWGNDTIKDFEANLDFINLQGVSQLNQLTITQSGSNVVIAVGANTITIENTSVAQIDPSHILL